MGTGQRICWIVTLLSVAAAISAMMEVGPLGSSDAAPPTIFISLIVGLTAFICIWMFRRRDVVRARIKAGKDLLVRWSYTEEEWRPFARAEYERQRQEKRMLLKILTWVIVVAVVICAIISVEFGVWMVAILGGTWVLCWLAMKAHLRPYQANKMGAPPQALIAEDGLVLGAEFHLWRGWGNRLEEVGLDEGPPLRIMIQYSVPGGKGQRNSMTASVPVPAGKEEDAVKLLQRLERKNK